MQMDNSHQNKVRIDKWLWAARFFKTRGLAKAAIENGKVHIDGQNPNPAACWKPGLLSVFAKALTTKPSRS